MSFLLQVVIVPIWKKEEEKSGVLSSAVTAYEVLKCAGIRVKVDDSEQKTPGWKFNFWEMKVRVNSCFLATNFQGLNVSISAFVFNVMLFHCFACSKR